VQLVDNDSPERLSYSLKSCIKFFTGYHFSVTLYSALISWEDIFREQEKCCFFVCHRFYTVRVSKKLEKFSCHCAFS